MDKSSPIAIIGAGVFGLSTALHLVESGYTDITVFERDENVPSRFSAAFDLNKIIRAEYEDDFYTKLVLEALEGWKTPLFGPYYHQTGYIVATSGKAPQKAVETMQKSLSSVQSKPEFADEIDILRNKDDFKKFVWQFSGPLNGFKGYHNRLAGYGHSGNALKGVYQHCAARGVRFLLGERAGKVAKLVYDASGRCTGVQTADGIKHAAAKTVCALGAYGASLIPGLANFTVARCWSVAHVQLTEEEADFLRGIPVTNVRDLGFFFEPDPATRLFKLCPLGAGFTNTVNGTSTPTEFPSAAAQDFIPPEDERKLRTLLRETLPWMADRPFVDRKFCWFSDTKDSEYCIDFVPGTSNSVVVLGGDSGHGFKMMPVFGKWVKQLLETSKQELPRWQWRTPKNKDDNWGDAVSWRVGTVREMKDLIAENEAAPKARL
ncbi:sarcosine oxidase [Colletotrichum karsti]|uniref:Sarcosine oxidase n=1 Tax=Colletotrichum karsti TaxID=1095194 RepID=A0A9P6ICN4_9PEZI|nr:sarcosine oxidase [Colletotrichum karsti]KAF9880962.1 sarcosine oxidase [Colletotrichum karsti]